MSKIWDIDHSVLARAIESECIGNIISRNLAEAVWEERRSITVFSPSKTEIGVVVLHVDINYCEAPITIVQFYPDGMCHSWEPTTPDGMEEMTLDELCEALAPLDPILFARFS